MPPTHIADTWRATLTRAAVLGLGCFAGAELGQALSLRFQEQAFSSFWPPAGILVATLALSPPRSWPILLAAACGATLASDVLLHGRPTAVGLGYSLAHCGEAAFAAALLGRFVRRPVSMGRVGDVVGLFIWAAVVGPLLGAAVGAGVAAAAFEVPYGPAWRAWWIADALGVIVVAPAVLAWAVKPTEPLTRRPWAAVERVAVFVGMAVMVEGVYGELLPSPFTVPIFILPFLVWAGYRFGPRGATAAVFVVCVIGVWNTCHGRGPYAGLTADPHESLARAQAALMVVSLTVVGLAAIVAERDRAERERLRLIAALEQALAEVKTLRGLIPICAWCRKVRDDHGSWHRLEAYLRANTDATLTHGVCPDCLDEQLAAVARAPDRGDG